MVGSALLFLGLPEPLVRLYTDDPAVIAVALSVLPVVSAFQIFDGVQIVSVGALRGAGDLRFPVVLTILGYWLFGLPLAYHLGFQRGFGPVGVWGGIAIGLGAMASLLMLRLRWTIARGGQRVTLESAPVAQHPAPQPPAAL